MSLDETQKEAWLAMQIRRGFDPVATGGHLSDGDRGGTSGRMTVPMKDYVDSRDDAVESRLMAKVDTLSTRSTVWGATAAIIGAFFTAVAIILGTMAFGGDRFDAGMGTADQRLEQLQRDKAQDESVTKINEKLDLLLAGQRTAKP